MTNKCRNGRERGICELLRRNFPFTISLHHECPALSESLGAVDIAALGVVRCKSNMRVALPPLIVMPISWFRRMPLRHFAPKTISCCKAIESLLKQKYVLGTPGRVKKAPECSIYTLSAAGKLTIRVHTKCAINVTIESDKAALCARASPNARD